jgi:REP element-mobilizing transposase RayT
MNDLYQIFHIIIRGNNKKNIFDNDSDKKKYLFYLKRAKDRIDFDLFSYVVMDNHIHMLIRTTDEQLSKLMQRINTSYSKFYNEKYKRTGHTFEKRYKKILCKDEANFLQLIKYIHRNPQKIATSIDTYKYSSHIEYISNSQTITNIDFLLDILSRNRQCAIVEYLKLMEN